jgi:hypothetical protein
LILPALVVYLARSAWRGLRGLQVLTHFGVRSGSIARIYGVLYLLFLAVFLALAPYLWLTFKGVPSHTVAASLRFIYRMDPLTSLLVVATGCATALIAARAIRRREADQHHRGMARRGRPWLRLYLYSHTALFLGIGIVSLVGVPYVILVGILVAWAYFVVAIERLALYDSERKQAPA